MTNIQYNLINLRKQLKLTQKQTAYKLGIKQPTYAAYEEGRAEPSYSVMLKIESFYSITFKDLVSRKLTIETKTFSIITVK